MVIFRFICNEMRMKQRLLEMGDLMRFFFFQAYVDLVRAWGWKSFTIVYENSDGLVRLQELLKAHGPSELPVAVRQLPDSHDYRLTPYYL